MNECILGLYFENFWSEYQWEEDLKYAKAVCNEVTNSTLYISALGGPASYSLAKWSHILCLKEIQRTAMMQLLTRSPILLGLFLILWLTSES